MRRQLLIRLLLALTAAAVASPAASILYDNTSTDTGYSVFYSASGVSEIGDRLQLTGAATVGSVTTQFYNGGSDATFDAILRFYEVGSPVGAPIGGPYTVTGVSIGGSASQNVTFAVPGVAIAQDVIVTLAVLNVSAGGDIGVNFFDPPSLGSSSNGFYITFDGTDFAQAYTNLDLDNVYFQIASAEVPEPGTAGTVFAVLVLAACRYRRRCQ